MAELADIVFRVLEHCVDKDFNLGSAAFKILSSSAGILKNN